MTRGGPVSFTVDYADTGGSGVSAITLASGDVTLNKTLTADATTVEVGGSGTATRTVTISGITGDGTLGISIAANTAVDVAGNNALAAGPSGTFDVDNTKPTVTLETAITQADPAKDSPIKFTAAFSEPAPGFINTDVTIEGTAAGEKTVELGGGPVTWDIEVSGMTTDGTVIASIEAEACTDTAGNANEASTSTDNEVTYDTTAPTLTISGPSAPVTKIGPVTYTVTYSGADDVTLGDTDVSLYKTDTADGAAPVVDGTGLTERTVTINDTTGTGTLGINIAAGTASDAAGNTALAYGPSSTFDVDNTAPELTVNPLGTTNDLTPTLSGTVGDNLAVAGVEVTVNGNSYDASFGGGSWDVAITDPLTGTPPADYTASVTATDTAGNTTTVTDDFTVDSTSPTQVEAVLISGASPTNAATVDFEVRFSVGVSPVVGADFALHVTGGMTGVSIHDVAGSGDTWTVTVNTGDGDGTIRLDVIDLDTIIDVYSHPLGGTGTHNGDFSLGGVCTIDKTRPGVSLTSTTTSPTNSSSIPVVVTFTEDVSEIVEGNVTVSNATKADWFKISNKVYHVNVNPIADGEVTADIAADVAHDMAGNGNTAATQLSWTRDTMRPTVTIGPPSVGETTAGPVEYLVTYSGVDVVHLTSGDVHLVATGDVTAEIIVSGGKAEMTRTITIVNIAGEEGTLAITIDPGTGCDAAGNCDLGPPGPSGGESEAFAVTPGMPVAGTLSLGLLAAACALAGVIRMRRKR